MKKIILPLISCGVILAGCNQKQVKTIPQKHVDVQIVHSYNVPYIYDYPAMVQGVVDYPVIPRVSGAIFKQYYTEGSYVKKGTPLYQIDPRPFELDLQTYQGNLIRDKAAMDNYKLIYDRYVKLYAAQAVSQQDLELQQINYQTAQGNVQADEANINQAKLNLEYAVVRAPADGYIAERQVTVGDMVTAWQTVMNQINSANDMYINFSMPENDRLAIQNGLNNGVLTVPNGYKFRIDLQLADGTQLKNSGYVQFTDTRISLQNGVWNMRAYVDNKQLKNQLLSGQFVHIYLNGVTYKDAFAIPQEAVFRDDKGAFVYIVKDGKVTKQSVVTGPMTDDLWIISSGLTNGMQVITAGGVKVMAGDKIVVDNTTDQEKIVKAIPAVASAPKAVTPPKINASNYLSNSQQRQVKIDKQANLYSN
ncbi:MAG: hypothetical protein RLZZ293_719 [Pseudomonadota bacterium]|jgi:RND family efflux transporter MFP subunit